MKARDNHIKIGIFYVLSVVIVRLLIQLFFDYVIFSETTNQRIVLDAAYFVSAIFVVGIGYYIQRFSILNTIEETYKISFYWTVSLFVLEILEMILFRDGTAFKTLGYYFYFICFYFSPILYRFFKRI